MSLYLGSTPSVLVKCNWASNISGKNIKDPRPHRWDNYDENNFKILHAYCTFIQTIITSTFGNIAAYVNCFGMRRENSARVSTKVGRWLSRRDTNIVLTYNASISNSFRSVSIDFRKNYIITFFIGNLISYISWSNFFSLPRLETMLGKVISEKPIFGAQMGIFREKHQSDFGYVV